MDQNIDGDAFVDALLQSKGDAIVVCDHDGVIRFWNPGAVRIFGFTEEEAIGQSLDIIIPERLRARHWDGYHQMMRTGQSRYAGGDMLSVPSHRKDGTRLSIEFTIVPIKGAQGKVTALAAVMRDATSRFEEMKALRQQLREKTG
ncbi:MAG TPA: PAS domain S-box protein [Pseudolabrys sp.]|nr:PAS domain S-box protein [Pseudolabrys sp.]